MRAYLLFLMLVVSILVSNCGRLSDGTQNNEITPSDAQPSANGPSARLPRSSAPFKYALDRIAHVENPSPNSAIVLKPDQNLELYGWSIDEAAGTLAGGVDVAIDGVPFAAQYGSDRPDIVAFYKRPELGKSGFRFAIPAGTLGPGKHVITIRPLSGDKTKYYESAPVVLEIQ